MINHRNKYGYFDAVGNHLLVFILLKIQIPFCFENQTLGSYLNIFNLNTFNF